MAYTINLTDGSTFATIADGTINTSSSMTLVGKNYDNYGTFVNQNYMRLLENASNTTAPTSPITGQLWWDKANKILKVYNGTSFKVVSTASATSTAPPNAVAGDLWFDTSSAVQQLKVYTGTAWLIVGPTYNGTTGTTGAIAESMLDNLDISHAVVRLYVQDSTVGFISKDATFTPKNSLSGFTTIRPGITLSTLVGAQVPLFQGTATNAQLLDSLDSTQFMRSDANTTTTGTLTVLGANGITVGTSLKSNVSGTTAQITNQTSGGNLVLAVNVGGTITPAISINGTTGIPTAPTAASNTSTTQIATTAFVTTAVVNATGALGTMSTQNANAVSITGGSLSGVSASLIGTPTAPTAAPGTITEQIATTAFVISAVANSSSTLGSIATQNANAVSITGGSVSNVTASLTGTPTAPTPTAGDSSTKIATTAFVQQNGTPTGSLLMWSTTLAPSGYLLCNGLAVSRSTYASLYAVIGTTFGSGDGSTTFNLPDYRNRMPIGAGSAYSAGATGGSADAIVVSHTHTATSAVTDPGHNHKPSTEGTTSGYSTGKPPLPYLVSRSGLDGGPYTDINTTTSVTNVSVATTVGSTGSSGTNANLPPYLGIYFIIKT
jgi:microcystin-dependent protein